MQEARKVGRPKRRDPLCLQSKRVEGSWYLSEKSMYIADNNKAKKEEEEMKK